MSDNFSLIIKNGSCYINGDLVKTDLGLSGKKIKKIGKIELNSSKVFDATNKIILPGIIDTQVHFREPGSTDAEDLESGSRAAVLGIITARYLDNPRKFQPVVRDLKIDFKAPAMTDIVATAYFSVEQAVEMNAKLEETGRYDFQQKAVLTDANGTVVAETLGSYALRNFMG